MIKQNNILYSRGRGSFWFLLEHWIRPNIFIAGAYGSPRNEFTCVLILQYSVGYWASCLFRTEFWLSVRADCRQQPICCALEPSHLQVWHTEPCCSVLTIQTSWEPCRRDWCN